MSDATVSETMAVVVSRELHDDDLVFVGVGTSGRAFTLAVGIPMVAARLAQTAHAPTLDIYWGNLLNPDLSAIPEDLSQDTITRWPGAYAPTDIGSKVDMLVRGEFDVSFESAAQVDRFGNCNITRIGRGDPPDVRLVGSLAQPEHLAFVQRPIIVVDLSPRVFVAAVDFVSSAGHGTADGPRDPASRAPGPALVVTDRCVFDFDDRGRMRLRSVHEGTSVDDVLDLMSFRPEVPVTVPTTLPPTPADLAAIRDTIDPGRSLLRA
jgi:glutaconate CoA-transferase, subunit B